MVWGLPGCLGPTLQVLTAKPAGRLVNAMGCRRHLGTVHAQKRGSAAVAQLLLLWPWGGRFKENTSTSIHSGCGKGYRWLRLALQGGMWDLSRFLKYYLCLSNKNCVRAECVPKQMLLMRVLAESGKALMYQLKTEKESRTLVCKHMCTPR